MQYWNLTRKTWNRKLFFKHLLQDYELKRKSSTVKEVSLEERSKTYV